MARPRTHAVVERVCRQCGKEYASPEYLNPVFCSKECWKQSIATPVLQLVCEGFGAEFEWKSRGDRPVNRFCSRKCIVRYAYKFRGPQKGRPQKRNTEICSVEGCGSPSQKIWSVTTKAWYGTMCVEHRKQHRDEIALRYDSVKKYGPEFADVHVAIKKLKRALRRG